MSTLVQSILLFTFGTIVFSTLAFAQLPSEQRKKWSSRDSSTAVGIASNSQLLYHTETSITALFDIGKKAGIQAFLVVPSSDPMTYGLGAQYKYTISGGKSLGFHVGGGLGIGDFAKDRSFLRIMGVAGLHFKIRKRILIHADTGLTLTRDDDPTGGDEDSNQTTITGNSILYGLSIMYMF